MKHRSQCVYVDGELYILGGLDDEYKCKSSIIEYSSSKNKWETIAASMYDGRRFSKSCSFLDNVYIIGGVITPYTDFNTCIELNTKSKTWREVSEMAEPRHSAACEIFEEKLVISGGYSNVNVETFKSSEANDCVADS